MTKSSLNKLPLKSLFRLDTTSCLPASQPKQAFLHHSIPAWDESGGPVVELGNTIGSNKFLISYPCVLVSKLNPRKSRVSVVRDLHGEFPQCASTEFMVYVPILEDADIEFYSWYMKSECFQGELERVATGTTNSHVRVTPKETLNWKIAHPLLSEQRRIAEILDTIDEAIQKTEALITKLKAMKQGLLHDLLIRGLDKNGKLRDPQAHLIPFSDVVQVNPKTELCGLDDTTNVSCIPMSDVSESGQWVIRQTRSFKDVRNGYTCFKENDILFAKITPCMENGKGGHAIGLVHGIGFGTTEFHVLRAGAEIEPRYIYYWTMTEELRRKAEAQMTGSAGQRRVPAEFFDNFKIPRVPRPEQHKIVEILDVHDARIRTEEQYRDKLKLQKKGIMHDLLTGKVRVKG